jgi:hypothetical protein
VLLLGQTAPEIISQRVIKSKENMGLTTWRGENVYLIACSSHTLETRY